MTRPTKAQELNELIDQFSRKDKENRYKFFDELFSQEILRRQAKLDPKAFRRSRDSNKLE